MSEELRTTYFQIENTASFLHRFPDYCFLLGFGIFTVMSVRYRFSLIPSLGLLCCFYMLSQLGYKNWLYFGVWLIIGLIIYFVYGRRHSKLATH
jgi:hypothetical protein